MACSVGRRRRRPVRPVHASNVWNAQLAKTDAVHIVVRGNQELDELAFGPDVDAAEVGQADWPRPGRVHIPTRFRRARAPPPYEGAAAFGNAFELGHAASNESPNASGKPKVTGCHMEHCEQ